MYYTYSMTIKPTIKLVYNNVVIHLCTISITNYLSQTNPFHFYDILLLVIIFSNFCSDHGIHNA